jgi:hypothetical protein
MKTLAEAKAHADIGPKLIEDAPSDNYSEMLLGLVKRYTEQMAQAVQDPVPVVSAVVS